MPTIALNNDSTICLNVVVSVEYQIIHNGTQGILEVNTFYKLQNISIHKNQLVRKDFRVTYRWARSADKPVLRRSGRPGYITGKPVISGNKSAKRVMYGVSEKDWMHVMTAGVSGLCKNRHNLLFRENIMSRCFLNVNGTCEEIQKQVCTKQLFLYNLSKITKPV